MLVLSLGVHDRYCEQSGRSENTTFQFTECFAVRVTLTPGLLPATLPLPARSVVVHVAGLFVEQVRVQLYTVLVSKLSGAILAMKGQLRGQTFFFRPCPAQSGSCAFSNILHKLFLPGIKERLRRKAETSIAYAQAI